MTAHDQHKSAYQRPLDTVKPQVIGYNRCRLGLAAEKRVVPLACLHLHWDMTTRDGGFMDELCLEDEEWRDVVGYEGLYQVSNTGRVCSLDRWVACKNGRTRFFRGRMLKLHLSKNGYYYVCIREKWKLVHRLVAEAFLPTATDEQTHVDHIDGNKTNNHVSNLRYCTAWENIQFAVSLGSLDLNAARKRGGAATRNRIPLIRSDGKRFRSLREAAKAIGRNESTLSIVLRKGGKCNGYSFRIDEEALERS